MTGTDSPTLAVDPTTTEPDPVDAFAGRVFSSVLGAMEVFAIHLGDRLGWYRALAESGPLGAAELARVTGTDERYAREWLEQQAVTGIVTVADDSEQDGVRRFGLPPHAATVLTDVNSLAYLAPAARMAVAAAVQMPALLDAYRTGGGVGWSQFGADMRESQGDMNRPWFEQELPGRLAAVPAVHSVLSRDGARIADLGCGFGYSTTALATAYPSATVDGFDLDAPSLDSARVRAAALGVGDRARFHDGDVGRRDDLVDGYDAVFAFECVHDLAHPVAFLATARRMVRPDGVVIVMDEATDDDFQAPADEVQQLLYGFSLFVCLPDGRSHPGSAATGTVMRRSVLRDYATAAGFRDVSVLPIDEFGIWRFYQLQL